MFTARDNEYHQLNCTRYRTPTKRNYALLPYQQVLIALQYYATGTFHMVVGDPLQVRQPTAFRAIHRVTNDLCRRIHDFVKLPDENTLPQTKDEFYQLWGFPGVIGLIDGTHIWIVSPGENEVDFVNRKGYHSVNVLSYMWSLWEIY